MPLVSPQNLFPLPTTPFERFMLADQSANYPMQFYMQVRLKGVVDRVVLKAAVEDALSRHPLLCCRVEGQGRKSVWVWAENEYPDVDWDVDHWMQQQPWRRSIDLTKDIGLRAWGEQHDDHAVIVLQYHHACCDGLGAGQFLEDIALGYARHHAIANGQETDLPELRPVNIPALKNRNDTVGRRVANLSSPSLFHRFRIITKYTIWYLRQKKLPILPKPGWKERKDQAQSTLGLLTSILTRAETRAVRQAAKKHNASLNDYLVRELMVTAREWNSKIETKPKRSFSWKQPTLCVLVPTSLRGPADGELPACNVVSYIFMARPVKLVDEPEELLITLRDEMQLVHKHQAGWMFVQAIAALEKIPGMLRLIMKRAANSCMSTTVLSHMGNMLNSIGSRLPKKDGFVQMGNLLVEDIAGIPPIREGTLAAFSTLMVRGGLSVSIRCCPDRFSEQDTHELLNMFLDRLRTAGTETQ